MFTENQKNPLSHLDLLSIVWLYYLYIELTGKSSIFILSVFIAVSILYVFFVTSKENRISQKIEILLEKYNAYTFKWAENHTKILKFSYLLIFFIPVVFLGIFLDILPAVILMIVLIMGPIGFSIAYAQRLLVKV